MAPYETVLRALHDATTHIAQRASRPKPTLGVVLGSGLGAFADSLQDAIRIPYASIPGFLPGSIEGHAGELVLGRHRGVELAVLSGRIHDYEGHELWQVTLPVRTLAKLGCKRLVVTNAAGGLNPSFDAGEMMVLRDQINLTGKNPLRGPTHPDLGARFVDMSQAFCPSAQQLWHKAAEVLGMSLREGIYLGVAGPSYETPAEVRMMHAMGGDAVGMSTVHEVIVARQVGLEVAGLSVITNKGAGLGVTPLSHAEVTLVAERVRAKVVVLLGEMIARWA